MTEHENIQDRSREPIIWLRDRVITIEAWLFTQQRLRFYGSGVLVAYAIGLAVRAFRHSWMFRADGKPSCDDFSHMWVSGSLAGLPDSALVYNLSTFSAA